MKLSKDQLSPFFEKTKVKADRITLYYFIGNFLFGIFLAPFYDTWVFAFLVGGINLFIYFSARFILPKNTLYQYIGSGVSALFVAQFIYQMHGMFEMHFFVFVASLAMVAYHNWKLQIPLISIIIIHHALFAWLQYSGMKDIYFTQLDYMTLQTFIFHGALASLIVFMSGYWSYDFRTKTIESAKLILTQEQQLDKIQRNISFAEKLSKGELNAVLETDELGQLEETMLHLQRELIKSREKEEQDRFMATGINEINNIVRNYQHDVQELCDKVIAKTVKYLNLNQGGLFTVEGENDNDIHLNLKAHYAYDRKKYGEKRIEIGQGLVGQAYLEKDKIYRTEVPQKFFKITSGLGESTPSSIVVIPLVYNEKVEGVIELASFRKLQEHEQAFLMKAGENIASSLSLVKTNQQTKTLLENTKQQTSRLLEQEEEMRQSMEELVATQEEMRRNEAELHRQMEMSKQVEQTLKLQLEEIRKKEKSLKGQLEASLNFKKMKKDPMKHLKKTYNALTNEEFKTTTVK